MGAELRTVLAVLTVGLVACSAASAQRQQDDWVWRGGVAGMIPSLSGHIVFRGATVPFELDMAEVLDKGTGFNGFVQATKDKQTIFANVTYLKLEDSGVIVGPGGSPVDIDASFRQTMFAAGYTHDFSRLPPDKKKPMCVLDIQGSVGFRVTDLSLEVNLRPAGSGWSSERSKTWFEPFVGLQATYPLTPKVAVMLKGDYGGFGIGSASDATWTIGPNIVYKFNPNVAASVGWGWTGLKHDDLGENISTLDYTMNGPTFSVTATF